MDISIIVPVYNAEEYIVKCLDSIFNQHFDGSFEVIAVDDASNDGSLLILKKYQENEVRLKIIEHEVNRKQAIARVTGMNAAKGNYIMHVDADDWLLPGTFDRLHNISIEYNPDVILFNYVSVYKNGTRKENNLINVNFLTTDKISIQKYFYGNSATKFVRRSLIENMITGKETINSTADDLLYCTEILLRADSFYLLPETFYIYFINYKSLTHTVSTLYMLQNMPGIVNHIKKITDANHADTLIINNLLEQIENKILSYSLPYWLSGYTATTFNVKNLINSLELFPEMTDQRLNQINSIFKKRKFAFYYSFKNYGLVDTIKIVLGTIYYNFIVGFKLKDFYKKFRKYS
jgi:glycosyltransferase involved in cell wall biosynthesis